MLPVPWACGCDPSRVLFEALAGRVLLSSRVAGPGPPPVGRCGWTPAVRAACGDAGRVSARGPFSSHPGFFLALVASPPSCTRSLGRELTPPTSDGASWPTQYRDALYRQLVSGCVSDLQTLKLGEPTVTRDLTGVHRIASRFGENSLSKIRATLQSLMSEAARCDSHRAPLCG